MIGIEIIKGQGIVTLPGVVLLMTEWQFSESRRRGQAWRRRQLLTQRLTTHGAGGPIAE